MKLQQMGGKAVKKMVAKAVTVVTRRAPAPVKASTALAAVSKPVVKLIKANATIPATRPARPAPGVPTRTAPQAVKIPAKRLVPAPAPVVEKVDRWRSQIKAPGAWLVVYNPRTSLATPLDIGDGWGYMVFFVDEKGRRSTNLMEGSADVDDNGELNLHCRKFKESEVKITNEKLI